MTMVTPVSFAMFLIDRGAADAWTLGQWYEYCRTARGAELRELWRITQGNSGKYGEAIGYTATFPALLVELYPDHWLVYLALRRMLT
jgi:hypothetical protein